MAKLEITLVRGLIGKSDRQRRTAAALGLTKKHQTVTHNDTPSVGSPGTELEFAL